MIVFEPLQPSTRLPVGSGHALQPGAMLEDFEITKVLGLTSFGVVYLATNVVEQTTVALKEYLPAAIAMRNAEGLVELRDPSHEEAFQRGLQSFIGESLTLSQFNHPNLLHVTCVWEGNGTAYRAMPHYTGNSLLAKRFGMKAAPDQANLDALLNALLAALELLNNAGLAHGQIEPINIFMPDAGQPVLLDFDAARHAILSDMHAPHVDAYADAAQLQQHIKADLHAVAAVLHFAISGHWAPPMPGMVHRHEPLGSVVARLADASTVQDYRPEFLSAIDTALALAPANRPASVADFRALFSSPLAPPAPAPSVAAPAPMPASAPPAAAPSPVAAAPAAVAPTLQPKPAAPAPATPRARPPRREVPDRPQSDYPLNSSESVLALLAGFDRRPKDAADDIEPFQSPAVPTLTEEAEPALPPMRTSLFDAVDAGDSLPRDGVGYMRPIPMAPAPGYRWGRIALLVGVVAVALTGLVMLASRLFR